ncbi:MAG: pyridoxal phosphate-dependent aminotransferase [Deltaproteobacteria bacterium]|nr:pyridoxal phosphate-dependent aminotransferase [Deltaproteobacteria bacterium]
MPLSQRLSLIKPSLTMAVEARAKALKKAGIDIIGFGAGEPDFDTPDFIKEAAVRAIRDGFTRYTPVGGMDELKEAVCFRFKTDLGLEYQPQEVVVGCGGKHVLYNIAQALWGPGDEVLVPAPCWVSYPPLILLAGATPILLPTREENGFKLTPEELAAAVTERTRALILNSPSNPTGAVYDREELEALGRVILEKDLLVVSDDIYDKILFDGRSFVNLAQLGPEYRARTLVVNGVSKSYAMTGWRIGFLAGPPEIIDAVNTIQSHSTSNPNSIAQKAAVAALTGPQDFVPQMVAELNRRRNYIVDRLNALPGIRVRPPAGAFYIFPDFSAYFGRIFREPDVKDSLKLADYLLEKAQIAVVPGAAFGADSCLRFSYTVPLDLIEKGLKRLEKALSRL